MAAGENLLEGSDVVIVAGMRWQRRAWSRQRSMSDRRSIPPSACRPCAGSLHGRAGSRRASATEVNYVLVKWPDQGRDMKPIKGSRWGWGRFALGLALAGLFASAEARIWRWRRSTRPATSSSRPKSFLPAAWPSLTQGQLAVQIKHSAQLGNEGKYWESVRNGSVDVVRINLGGMVKDIQSARLLSLPYLFRSRDHMWRVLGGDFGKRVKTEVEKTGAVVLAYYDSGARSFYTTQSRSRSDPTSKGLRIRVQDSPIYRSDFRTGRYAGRRFLRES